MSFIKTLSKFQNFKTMTYFVILAEILLGSLIIKFIPYTEIDWVAYMQQIETFLGGERNYMKIRGDTGPLVYPAGHVYIFTALYYITDLGKNILLAQFIFLAVYVAQTYVLCKIYERGTLFNLNKWWLLGLLMVSRRVHSIYMLRCFNDCIAMFLAYIAVYLLMKAQNQRAVVFFALAISVKMNVLLFLPGLYLIVSRSEGIWKGTYYLIQIVLIQLVLGYPFIQENPMSYFNKAFEFKREFFFKWSVNWKFLGEDIALDPTFALILLCLHLSFLLYFLFSKWISLRSIFKELSIYPFNIFPSKKYLNPEYTLDVLFICNFIGILFARSLHYQFYCWYFHTIPWLLLNCNVHEMIYIPMIIIIEVCWNVFPPSTFWSIVLLVMNLLLLLGQIMKKPIREIYFQKEKTKID